MSELYPVACRFFPDEHPVKGMSENDAITPSNGKLPSGKRLHTFT